MIATIIGTLVSRKMKVPEQGQEFKPHLALTVMQMVNDEAEIQKIKDYDLEKKYENKSFNEQCQVKMWSFNGNSGLTCTVLGSKK